MIRVRRGWLLGFAGFLACAGFGLAQDDVLGRALAKEVRELFGYQAGLEPVKAPMLSMLAEGEESPL